MHIHILGICGTFMGGLAALAREAGHKVTGCDAGVYPPMSDQLKALGIELMEGFGVEQMQLKPDLYVIGNVVSRSRLPNGADLELLQVMQEILAHGISEQNPVLVQTVMLRLPIILHDQLSERQSRAPCRL